MSSFSTVFLVLNAIMLLFLPRRWAPLPLLVGACYITLGQGIEIGPFTFTVIRMLVAVGVVRVIIRGERLAGRINGLDQLMLVWGAWAVASSVFHNDPLSALIFRLGLVYNACGIYFLVRIFCQSFGDLILLIRITGVLLVPLSLEMINEQITSYNLFSIFGGVQATPAFREGRIRAQGPFAHSILAGTIGAVCLPLMIGIWQQHRKSASVWIAACIIMIFTSVSSGPILSSLAGIGALFIWRFRHRMRLVRWLAVFGYIGLEIVMKAPAYYLIARVSAVSGGGGGYHRARLIQASIEHLAEWWLAGTDYTRHWMVTGVSWSPNHTDITNHYIQMGVIGGLPLMFLFIFILLKGFSLVGHALHDQNELTQKLRFMVWALGASLFTHAVTFISVSYFDQSFIFIYLTLGAIGSLWFATNEYRTVFDN